MLIRHATADDLDFLVDMLVEAVNWEPGREPLTRDQVLAAPEFSHYVAGWPRAGETGVIAEDEQPVGAAWLRFLPANDPGYGFVSPDIPELTIGVVSGWRGKGVGRALVRAVVADVDRVSLSVERVNPARNLYLQEGFVVVSEDRDADTMLRSTL